MYMNIEMVLIIGTFALLAMAGAWARMLYSSVRKSDAIQGDGRARAAAARQTFKAATRQSGHAGAEAR